MTFSSSSFAVEIAPRISDREIVERLTRLEEGQKSIDARFDDLRSELNNRFDIIQWMFVVFITVTITILGFVLRMMWQMQKRQIEVETSLETQKDELAFIKRLIERFLPPGGAL